MNVKVILAKMVQHVQTYWMSTNANVRQDSKEPTVRQVSSRIRPYSYSAEKSVDLRGVVVVVTLALFSKGQELQPHFSNVFQVSRVDNRFRY